MEFFFKMDIIFWKIFELKEIQNSTTNVIKFYSTCKNFVQLIFKSEFSRTDISNVKTQALEVIKLYVEVAKTFESEPKISPKLHHILHIAQSIELFGPPYQFMTLRHERKHQISKSHFRTIRCSKNIEKSIITREVNSHEVDETNKTKNVQIKKWSMKKNIVKQIIGKDQYVKVTKFSSNTHAKCDIFEIERIDPKTKQKFLKLTNKNVFIKYEDMCPGKDFLYEVPASTDYLLSGWPLI